MAKLMESLNITSSPYFNALISMAAFVFIAGLLDLVITRVLRKFAKITKTTLDDRILDIVHRPVFLTVIVIGVLVSLSYLNPPEKVVFYSGGVLYSIITVIWGIVIIRISNLLIEYSIASVSDVTGLRKDIVPLVENILLIVLLLASVFIVLSIWKINITPILASAGIAGVLVALAAKDTVANFLGGISIFIDRPFKIGDYIVLGADERGEVVAIGIRSTRIQTRDDILITIPNSIIAGSKIVNESAPVPKFRVRIRVTVAYGSDIDLVERVLTEIASSTENVVEDPSPRVRFREFGDSSLNFELLCWVREPALRGLTIHELNCAIYKKFHEAGITIPFPQRDVHLYSAKDGT